MYRLTDDIARRRLLYPAPIAGVPAVLLIDLPHSARGPGLALGRYYPIMGETEEELAEINAFLDAPRPNPIRPDLLDMRPSQVRSDEIALIRFDPPHVGWPWLSVCRWPTALTVEGEVPAAVMARGCYTFEAFNEVRVLEAHQSNLLASLRRFHSVSIRLIAGEQLHLAGSA